MRFWLARLDHHLGGLVHFPRGVGAYLPGTLLAALAALLFAVGCVLQHDAAVTASGGHGVRFQEMMRHRRWVLGQLATVAGTALQVAALAIAPVSIVQPLLAASLIVALALRSIRTKCLPAGSELLGAALTAGGLAVFLVAARPAPGVVERQPHPLPVIAAVLLGVAVVALATRLGRGAAGALVCGIAAGLAAGIAAVLIASALKILSQQGLGAALSGPELWGAIVMAVTAQLSSQQAYSRGALTWSLPALTVCDPLAAVPVARLLLGERLEPGHAVVWVPAGVIAVVGILFLARSDDTCRRPLGAPRGTPRETQPAELVRTYS